MPDEGAPGKGVLITRYRSQAATLVLLLLTRGMRVNDEGYAWPRSDPARGVLG